MAEGESKTGSAMAPLPFWRIWENPIFRRYCRSRLRPRGLGFLLLITVILAAFLFFAFRAGALHRADMDLIDAERAPIIPLLVLQGILLFLLGTGQVAGGMTAEADEGVLDYQRLAPMTPLSKVLGFLFGLPIREWACFAATLPFTIWAFWKGEVLGAAGFSIYLAFLSSAVVYHLTGLVAGTVIKNRRWAFLASMGIIFLLYTIIPQIANFGMAHFRYLTLQPVFEEKLGFILPREEGATLLVARQIFGDTKPFGLDLPEVVFTLATQAVLGLALLTMVWRRWWRAESHLLGKLSTCGLFAAVQASLLANALPLIDSGLVFPSRELTRRFSPVRMTWSPDPSEVVAMVGAVGLVTLIVLLIFTSMITPSAETQLRGWRRVRKLGKTRLPPLSDPATAFWAVLGMSVCGAVGWYVFAREVVDSRWFPGAELPAHALPIFLCVLLSGGLAFHALLEARGAKTAVLATILGGVVPLLIGVIMGMTKDELLVPALWIWGISPISAPVLAAMVEVDVGGRDGQVDLYHAAPLVLLFWQCAIALVAIWLVVRLRRARKATAAKAE